MGSNKLIYGKNNTDRIVSIEIEDEHAFIYRELEDGTIEESVEKNVHWTLLSSPQGVDYGRLSGDLHYKYYIKHQTGEEARNMRQSLRRQNKDFFCIYDDSSAFQIKEGHTLFKNTKVDDVSVLSFDIETNGITMDDESKVFLISNTFRKGGAITKRLFSRDEYDGHCEMIDAWCDWVRQMDPSIMVAHNGFGFDIPYLEHCSANGLKLGRNDSKVKIKNYTRQFRKDGSQSYDYNNVHIYGRQFIDTFFLAIKYDVARRYPSYGLKVIVDFEGLVKEGRQFYDAGSIKDNWADFKEREKIKAYAIDDADDALALYDLMIPSFFYYTQSIPMSFQEIILRATGSQVNAFMLRAYLQDQHSVPKGSDSVAYEGAISFGHPGIYDNVFKVDVASLYPSIIRQYNVYDHKKDPKAYFLEMVNYFTDERLKNKSLANETGDRYYRDMEQSQKIMINSAYGFMGAPRLNFNSPHNAAKVTKYGRKILTQALAWADYNAYEVINADTDSFSICNFTGDTEDFLDKLNREYPEGIRWENDGIYKKFVIVKAKNYVLYDGQKTVIKGSGLKGTMKEPALQGFMKDVITCIIMNKTDDIVYKYKHYAREITNITRDTIPNWCSKKTITKSVLNPKRTNEQRIKDALCGRPVQEGDKIHVFFETGQKLTQLEDFNGSYDKDKLFEKLFKTTKIFESVLDISDMPNYKLKRNKKLLEIL